jgi:hypothetical protein
MDPPDLDSKHWRREIVFIFFILSLHPTGEAVLVLNMLNLKCRRFAGGEVFAECLSDSARI